MCEQWWDASEKFFHNHPHEEFMTIFQARELQREVERSEVIEVLSITILNFLVNQDDVKRQEKYLKTLIFNVHQAFLLKVHYILNMLPPYTQDNKYVQDLSLIVAQRRSSIIEAKPTRVSH